jgi:hypothetical protein
MIKRNKKIPPKDPKEILRNKMKKISQNTNRSGNLMSKSLKEGLKSN